jgi:3-oxoacyl-[acyl-carrier-protein] synthase II
MDHRCEDVVVTGMGAVSSLGVGCRALWEGIDQGICGIHPICRFSTEGLTVSIGGLVPEYQSSGDDLDRLYLDFGRLAAREAIEEAGLGDEDLAAAALVVGGSMGEGGRDPCRLIEALGDDLGLRGPRITVSTACASSANAIGLGRDLLRAGEVELVLAGGVDVLTPDLLAGFHALGALSREPCAPFSLPFGTSLSEGAGFLVLERRDHATGRRARLLASISGYGISGDAYHETTPHPRGLGVASALRGALEDAGFDASEVGYVNAHGTGTSANDAAEWRAIQDVFGDASAPPVSSTKGHIGHAQGGSAALEVITTIMALERQALPPTLNFTKPRPQAPSDPVAEARPRPHRFDHALCTSSAFGGANCAVLISQPEASCRRRSTARPVFLVGRGAVTQRSSSALAFAQSVVRGEPMPWQELDDRLHDLVRRCDFRGLDAGSIHLALAVALALHELGSSLKGSLKSRTGLVVGTTRTSPRSAREFRRSQVERGLGKVSTIAFARLVLNAAQGSCSKLHNLRGPQTTVATRTSSGLVALAHAADLLARRSDLDLALACAVEERDDDAEPSEDEQGATCLVLVDEDRAAKLDQPLVEVAGWALGGPDRLGETVDRALERAAVAPDRIGQVFGSRTPETDTITSHLGRARKLLDIDIVCGRLGAMVSGSACVAAYDSLRGRSEHEHEAALVVDSGGGSACCAVVLVRARR